jgi:hypothetical protein
VGGRKRDRTDELTNLRLLEERGQLLLVHGDGGKAEENGYMGITRRKQKSGMKVKSEWEEGKRAPAPRQGAVILLLQQKSLQGPGHKKVFKFPSLSPYRVPQFAGQMGQRPLLSRRDAT